MCCIARAIIGFLQHPQLWLIPVGLSVLLAAYVNEEDFTEDQMAGIRYMSLVMIYASSTADIFVNGVAKSPWLPLVLAGLSLAGVFSGIIFRIRGLLLLGCVISAHRDHYDDLVRIRRSGLDVVMVGSRNCHWSHDLSHVRSLRKETRRGVARSGGIQGVGPLDLLRPKAFANFSPGLERSDNPGIDA